MKRTLKQIAEGIKINWIRVGFDPETEQTKFLAIIGQQQFNFSCGLFACIYDKQVPETLSRSAHTYNPLDRLVKLWKTVITSSYPYFKVYQNIRSGQAKAIKNWGTWAQEVWVRISNLCEPTNYDLLYSLQLDCRADSQSFNQWCDEYGCDNDSIKALSMYNACVDEARKLKLAIGHELFKELMECEDID